MDRTGTRRLTALAKKSKSELGHERPKRGQKHECFEHKKEGRRIINPTRFENFLKLFLRFLPMLLFLAFEKPADHKRANEIVQHVQNKEDHQQSETPKYRRGKGDFRCLEEPTNSSRREREFSRVFRYVPRVSNIAIPQLLGGHLIGVSVDRHVSQDFRSAEPMAAGDAVEVADRVGAEEAGDAVEVGAVAAMGFGWSCYSLDLT